MYLPRRDLQELVRNERMRQVAERREGYDEVRWAGAGIVWAMDDTVCSYTSMLDSELWIHHVRDIGAGYSLQPISGREPVRGVEVAANLDALCCRHAVHRFFSNVTTAGISIPPMSTKCSLCIVLSRSTVRCGHQITMEQWRGRNER